MSGNAWEWCADWFASDYYGYSPVDNPAGPQGDGNVFDRRVTRGGSFSSHDFQCTVYHRSMGQHGTLLGETRLKFGQGFRLAR